MGAGPATRSTMFRNLLPGGVILLLFVGCGTQPIASTERHIHAPASASVESKIPQPVRAVPLPPPPKPQARAERYSVVVNNVPVQELLFALARDAKVNVDVHPGIEGNVTLNAIDQTLPQILSRIARQVDMRFEMEGPNLVVMPDNPYLKNYKVDYVNITRTAAGTVGISTQVATTGNTGATGQTGTGGGGGSGATGGNSSTTTVSHASNNRFWDTLIQNVKDMLRETDKLFPEGSFETQVAQTGQQRRAANAPTTTTEKSSRSSRSANATTSTPAGEVESAQQAATTEQRFTFREAASVIANPEAGVISVRATARQHEKVQEFLDRVIGSAKRQVLIEATIVEVTLNDQYQAGVDWSRVAQGGSGFSISQTLTGGITASDNGSLPILLKYANPNARIGGNIAAAIALLEVFGNIKVLSSPKIMALNNQTALLKVVDEKVYFTTEVRITDGTANNPPRTDFTNTLHTVPIGVVMSVTAQVGDNDDVSLDIRPTISRISGFVNLPTQQVVNQPNIVNRVPEIQVRELESILRVPSGQTVVLGGLMQDNEQNRREGVPGLSRVPVVGEAFSFRNDLSSKNELVIFLRPVIIRDATLASTLQEYQGLLPDSRFFQPEQATGRSREAAGNRP